jgi:hypothetical protein
MRNDTRSKRRQTYAVLFSDWYTVAESCFSAMAVQTLDVLYLFNIPHPHIAPRVGTNTV